MSWDFPGMMLGISGARGVVGQGLTPEVAARLSAAFGSLTERGDMLLARDSRPTGEALLQAAAAGLSSVGCTPRMAGLLTAPGAQVAVEEMGLAGGIMVTASHNPPEWNGLKFIGPDGAFISEDKARRLYEEARGDSLSRAPWDQWASPVATPQGTRLHMERIVQSPLVDAVAVRKKMFRVVVDCNHGAFGPLMRQLGAYLDLDLVLLGEEATGRFAHGAEPCQENLHGLGKAVREASAHLGAAVDPDGDRLVFCTRDGFVLPEEATLPIVAMAVLAQTPGSIVTNLSTSSMVDSVGRIFGIEVKRTPVGEAHVVAQMKLDGAVLGGEGNGGVIFPSIHYGRDAAAGLAVLLTHLARADATLEALWQELPSYHMTKRKMSAGSIAMDEAIASLQKSFPKADVDLRDGVKISTGDGWVHLRPSNTEPVMRIVAEAKSEELVEELIRTVKDVVFGQGVKKG